MQSLFSYSAKSINYGELKSISPAIISAKLDDFLISNVEDADRIRFVLQFATHSDWLRISNKIYNKHGIKLDVIIAELCPYEFHDPKLHIKKMLVYRDIDGILYHDWSYINLRYAIKKCDSQFIYQLVEHLNEYYPQGLLRSMLMRYGVKEIYEKFPHFTLALYKIGVNKTAIEVELNNMLYEEELEYMYENDLVPYLG